MKFLVDIARLGKALTDPTRRSVIRTALTAYEATPETECPCCGYKGRFTPFGLQARPGAKCPQCGSLERHRLFMIAHQREFIGFADKAILHFAPEDIIGRIIKKEPVSKYVTADLRSGVADKALNIEAIDEPDNSYDLVLCSHVLEHVDDQKALRELFRILRPGGTLVMMVPIVEGWQETYEDNTKTSNLQRQMHFGQFDHVRFYGSDFRDRVKAAGFQLDEFTALGAESVRFGLQRGEKVFRARHPL